jgi:hypothetical protein
MLMPHGSTPNPTVTAVVPSGDGVDEMKTETNYSMVPLNSGDVDTKIPKPHSSLANNKQKQPTGLSYQPCIMNNTDHQFRKQSSTVWALANVLTSPSASEIEGILSSHISPNIATTMKNRSNDIENTNVNVCSIPFPVSAFSKLVNCDGTGNAKEVLQEHLTVEEKIMASSPKNVYH